MSCPLLNVHEQSVAFRESLPTRTGKPNTLVIANGLPAGAVWFSDRPVNVRHTKFEAI